MPPEPYKMVMHTFCKTDPKAGCTWWTWKWAIEQDKWTTSPSVQFCGGINGRISRFSCQQWSIYSIYLSSMVSSDINTKFSGVKSSQLDWSMTSPAGFNYESLPKVVIRMDSIPPYLAANLTHALLDQSGSYVHSMVKNYNICRIHLSTGLWWRSTMYLLLKLDNSLIFELLKTHIAISNMHVQKKMFISYNHRKITCIVQLIHSYVHVRANPTLDSNHGN